MDNDKLDELERMARLHGNDYFWNPAHQVVGPAEVVALITAARRPALPDREAVARVFDRDAFTEGPWMWLERQQVALTKADAIIALFTDQEFREISGRRESLSALSPAQAERDDIVSIRAAENVINWATARAVGSPSMSVDEVRKQARAMLSAAPKEHEG